MCQTLDRFFLIKKTVENSEVPLSVYDISEILDMNVRTILRHCSYLVDENFFDLRVGERDLQSKVGGNSPYVYAKKGFWS